MFNDFISILKKLTEQRKNYFIKDISTELLEEYAIMKIYEILARSENFNNFENEYYRLRESAIRNKQDSIKDELDIIYTLAMKFKGDD